MKIKIRNSFFFLTIFLLISSNSFPINYIKENTIVKKKNIRVSNKTFSRIEGYLNGTIYSKNLNKKFIQIAGIYLSLSEDGNSSSISFCNADHYSNCAEQNLAYQTLKKCEKISKQKCYLVFRGKEFLPLRNSKINIKEIFILSKSNDKGLHADIHGKTLEEFHDPDN